MGDRPIHRAAETNGATPGRPPLIVLDGSASVPEHEVARLRLAGHPVVRGLIADPPPGSSVVRVAVIRTADDAARAVLAAVRGAGLLVATHADRELVDALVGDLRHVGRVEVREATDPPGSPQLGGEARALLALLAEGLSLGDAAQSLGLARRTADRRLADARRAVGVERTTEAIAVARRRGWLEPTNEHGAG